ncbi:MAG: acetamidase/formamidase family protein [Actinomycetota bacterium]|nr:acetamidase/formamidase family protein [Actinomycetota bacterium]
MIHRLVRDKISRGKFLARAGASLGTLMFGGSLAIPSSRANATTAGALGYDGNAANTTGTYFPEGAHHLVTSDKPEEISWGFLPNRDAKPVLTVASGDFVTMEQISHEGILEDQGNPRDFFASWGVAEEEILADQLMVFEEVEKKGEGPHVVTGPVAVEGAEPGDWLEVRCLGIEPRVSYGVNSARHGKGALPDEYPLGGKPYYGNLVRFDLDRSVGLFPAGNGIEVPLKPFMGIVGVAPNTSEMINTIPPDVYGGNIDVKHLMTAGSTAYYPVQVPGALLYTSDGHAAQGNGEVSLTAIETSQTPTFQLILHKKDRLEEEWLPTMKNPWGETEEAWIVTGMDEDLDEAMKEAVRETISFLTQTRHLSAEDAYSLASIGVDFEVSQVVDINKGIHAQIYKHLFPEGRSC